MAGTVYEVRIGWQRYRRSTGGRYAAGPFSKPTDPYKLGGWDWTGVEREFVRTNRKSPESGRDALAPKNLPVGRVIGTGLTRDVSLGTKRPAV